MPHLLLIAAHFAPSQAVGGRRAERMARHLSQLGWDVTVASVLPQYSPPIDSGLVPPEGCRIIRTHALMPLAWARQVREQLAPVRRRVSRPAVPQQATRPVTQEGRPAASPTRLLQRLRGQLTFPDEFAGWGPLLRHRLRGHPFDAVLVTAPPHSTCIVAAQIAAERRIPLILDYRDPWTEVHLGEADEPAHRAAEDAVLRQAALVVGVTPSICAWLRQRTQAPVTLIANAVETPPQQLTPGPQRTLVYVGSLAYGRSLAPILRTLRATDGKLLYAGADGAAVRAQADAVQASACVEDLGSVSRRKADELVRQARAAIVTVNPPLTYPYPGKIFDILSQGRPILLLGPPDCDAAQLVRAHQLGWAVADNDEPALQQTVSEALQGRIWEPVGMASLTAEATMRQLDTALRAAMARPG